MCEHGDTVDVVVVVPAGLSHSGRDQVKVKPVDRCIAPIVEALNDAGVPTVGSCCGHEQVPSSIVLEDGREIVVRDFEPFASHGLDGEADDE